MKAKAFSLSDRDHGDTADGRAANVISDFSEDAFTGLHQAPQPAVQPAKSAPVKSKVDRSKYISKTQPVSSSTGSHQTKFPLRKPGSKYFFRASDDQDARIIADTVDGGIAKIYVIGEGVTRNPRIDRHVAQALLVPCINERGQVFIWPINTRGREWYKSALEMVREAESQWIRIEADFFAQAYRLEDARDFPELARLEPKWPVDPSDVLDEALTSSAIDDDNDPVLVEIVGRYKGKEAA